MVGAQASKDRPVNNRTVDPVKLVTEICIQFDGGGYLAQVRSNAREHGLSRAVANGDNEVLFDWLMNCFSYQGVSDAVATSYIDTHGNVTFAELAQLMTDQPSACSKLADFDSFVACGYQKWTSSCNRPRLSKTCLVPRFDLRKGQLNQSAVSLFLFLRDRCDGNLVGFMDSLLEKANRRGHPDRVAIMRAALTSELTKIFGVSQKLINMAFADLLVGADRTRRRWVEVGASMVAVDSLVHNFLRRTGIHHRYDTNHSFGEACYGPNGCASIIDRIAREIDCSVFDPANPIYFPRLVQHAIWAFCAEAHHGKCNGRVIDDTSRCRQKDCILFGRCGRIPLRRAG